MANKNIAQFPDNSVPNILAEYLSMFGGVTTKTNLNDMQRLPVRSITADTTLTDTDSFIFCDATSGNIVITLPDITNAFVGKIFHVKKIDTTINNIKLDASTNGHTLEGENSQLILSQNDVISFTTDGLQWYAF